jgi:hypothetical protein
VVHSNTCTDIATSSLHENGGTLVLSRVAECLEIASKSLQKNYDQLKKLQGNAFFAGKRFFL